MTSVVGFYTEDKPFVESSSPRRSQRTLSKLWIRSRLDLRRRPKKKNSKAPCMFCEESFGKILKMREVSSFSRTGQSTNSIDWNESCDKHAVYFRRWLKWRAMFIAFWRFGNDVISLEWMSLISCIYTRVLNQFRNKWSNTIWKVNTLENTRPSIKKDVVRRRRVRKWVN